MQNNGVFLIMLVLKKPTYNLFFLGLCAYIFMLSIVIIAWEDILVEQTAFEATLQVCHDCISSIL